MEHELKTWPEYYTALLNGTKTFEFRKNDRDYQVGDTLILREWCPVSESYTNAQIKRHVTYVMKRGFGLPEGMAILGLERA